MNVIMFRLQKNNHFDFEQKDPSFAEIKIEDKYLIDHCQGFIT